MLAKDNNSDLGKVGEVMEWVQQFVGIIDLSGRNCNVTKIVGKYCQYIL